MSRPAFPLFGFSDMKRVARMVLVFAAVSVSASLVQGCASPDPRMQAAVTDQPFHTWLLGLTDQIKADPDYKRIPLDTSDQTSEFTQWLHDAYRHKITKTQFAQLVQSRYPGHQYETDFIIKRLPD
jgi:hypothetical protein